ncbi:MAG: AraC family transcriptional regulator [Pseudomonadota bacterium]|jgi:AraC-like DNA-binding protein|uniref:AraC family transcriptional regulator n=1 Tax=Paraburkholderia sp. TaxID=1926495 RepID=UPI0010F93AB6
MTESRKNLTILPELALDGLASGDLLSQVLARMRMTGDCVYSCELLPLAQLEISTQAAHACVVSGGVVEVTGDDTARYEIQPSELVLFPRGLRDFRLMACNGPATVVVCRFWFDPDSLQNLLFGLPALIHLRQTETDGWLDNIMRFLLHEAGNDQPGSALMVSRMIDLVVVRALRAWVHHGHASSWLGGLADQRIARALKAIHEQPPRGLTIDGLAAVAGMSRSSFCERFTALVGKSPLRYRNEWRLTIARDMLAKGDARVGDVGMSVGYESEAAFSRAYKTFFGHTPREAKPTNAMP